MMTILWIPMYLDFFVTPKAEWSNINSFDSCYQIDARLNAPKEMKIIQAICIAIYTLSEIIYTIVICRLFISNILRLSMYCKVLPTDPVKTSIFVIYPKCV